MKTITCYCENKFEVPFDETVNMDEHGHIAEDIEKGDFQKYVCPECGSVLKTDFAVRLISDKDAISIFYVPEAERFAYFSGTLGARPGDMVVIGYPELVDRMRVVRNALNAQTVEALKFHLLEKAYENYPDASLSVLFRELTEDGDLVFHLYGLKDDEIAVMTVPASLYERIGTHIQEFPNDEPYSALVNGQYISVQNISFEAEADEE